MFVSYFFRSHLLLISTHCIPLEQLVSHSHLNYTLYFFLQTIPDSFVFPSISSFLETWPFSQCIHECKHFQFSVKYGFIFGCCFERFISKVCSQAKKVDVEYRKENKQKKPLKTREQEAFPWAGLGEPQGLTLSPGPWAGTVRAGGALGA